MLGTQDIVVRRGGFSLPPVYPGRTLASELAARDLTAHALAIRLRVPANRISEIVAGKRWISAETALRLGRYFGTAALSGQASRAITISPLPRKQLGTGSNEVEKAA